MTRPRPHVRTDSGSRPEGPAKRSGNRGGIGALVLPAPSWWSWCCGWRHCSAWGPRAAPRAPTTRTSSAFRTPTPSEAYDLMAQAFPERSGDTDTVVWRVSGHDGAGTGRADGGSVRDHAVRERIEPALRKIAAMDGVGEVASPYAEGPAAAAQISRDGRIAYAQVTFAEQANAVPKELVEDVVDTARDAERAGLQVELGGQAITRTQEPPAGIAEVVGIRRGRRRALPGLRLALRDAAADRRRRLRRRHGHAVDDPARPCDRRPRSGPAARLVDRPRRRHRLRAVHRHPAPPRDPARHEPEDAAVAALNTSGPRGAVRGRHGVHRARRHAGDAACASWTASSSRPR